MKSDFNKINKSPEPHNQISEDEVRAYADSIIYTMREPLIIVDQDLKVVYASPSFCKTFRMKPEETLGKIIYELDNKQWDLPKLRQLLESILPKKVILKEVETKRNFNQIGERIILLNARQIKRILGKEKTTIVAVEDITNRRKTENKIIYLSHHDQLTGLYNRSFFEQELRRFNIKKKLPLGIMISDLNGLKLVNDTFGHSAGDETIRMAVLLLSKACRSNDILARWGGDKFIFLLPKTQIEVAEKVSKKIKKYFETLIIQKIPISISIGIAAKTELEQDIEETIKKAEDNMYKNKLLEEASSSWSIISALKQVLLEKSHETSDHTIRLQENALKIGKLVKLHPEQLDALSLLASLHDIGKIAIPESILNKKGKLTESEWIAIKRHPEIGFNIASSSPRIAHISTNILSCHENWDGSGYPQGLKGDEIPIISRIIFIVDSYDVMTHKRPYKEAMSKDEAIKELRRCSGTQFDPMLVKKLIQVISK